MPTYTYPGVYIEEIPSSVHTITGVATSIAAFAGWAPEGPTDSATLVLSWSDFERTFGGLDSRSYLGYAVNHFFANGGQQAYIIRLVNEDNGTAPAALTGTVSIAATGGNIALTTIVPGGWANSYAIQISPSTNKVAGDFKLSVLYAPGGSPLGTVEVFDNLSVGTVGAITSHSVTLAVTGTLTAPPANGIYPLSGATDVPAASPATVSITALDFNSAASPSTCSGIEGLIPAR